MTWKDIIKRGNAGRKDSFDFKEYGSIATKRPSLKRRKNPQNIYSDKPFKPLSPERKKRATEKAKETKRLNEEKRLREERTKKDAKYTGGQFLDKPKKEEEEKEPFNPFKRD